MITEAAVFLRDEVRRYLLQSGAIFAKTDVVLGNVATLEDQVALADRVVLTLVNLEEESTLKNGRQSIRNPATNGVETLATPVYLNLYLLFSATLPLVANDDDYQRALHRISSVVELFPSEEKHSLCRTHPASRRPT